MNQIAKQYQVQYPHRAYTWPVETRADKVTFDPTHMHIFLRDGRVISVPLAWIPTLTNATAADRKKVTIGWDGHLLHWDPDDGPINEDLMVASLMRYDEPER